MLEKIPQEQSPLNQLLFWDIYSFLQHNLNYTDKMAMSAGVEVRVPYLDKELVALTAHMPPELKMKGRQTKYILKQLAARYLPEDVIHRPKTGFGAPVRNWVRHEMQPMITQRLCGKAFTDTGIFDTAAIQQFIADNAAGKIDGAYTIWALLAVESWLREIGE
jgi:asparagine synthase (glutamine-hydrolysing)